MAAQPSYSKIGKLSRAKALEYSLVSKYPLAYRNREDITNLPPGVLIVGSQNVLHNVSDRIQMRKGYSVDGEASSVAAAVLGSFDWNTSYNAARNMRSAFLTSAGNDGKLQFRYEDASGSVAWKDLLTGLSSTSFNFTTYYDPSERLRACLFVNGRSQVQAWSGAVATYAASTNSSGYILQLNATPTAGGTGYLAGDILTITTGSGTATARVASVTGANAGSVTGIQQNANIGSGYLVGDTLTLPTGGVGATLSVTSVNGTGGVTGLSILTSGTGYSAGIYQNPTGGTGSGLKVLVTSIGGQAVASVTLVSDGPGYTASVGNATTGGHGTGATLKVDSVVQGSISVQGSRSITQLGFYATAHPFITLNGVTYSYQGIVGNMFIGISPDPTANVNTVGDPLWQEVWTVSNSAMTNSDTSFATFGNSLISVLNNQVFLGALDSPKLFVSKFGSFTDWSYSAARLPGEGAAATLDSNLVAFQPQDSDMYVSAGLDLWYDVSFPDSADLSNQGIRVLMLKSTAGQGARSQAATSQMKNNIVMITNEPTMDTFGTAASYFGGPQTTNLSDSIKLDFDAYDFTDCSIYYFKYFIYVAVPREGVVRVYNLETRTWEAPQTIPVSRFYSVGGELYGHSYSSSESYRLFTGYADRVHPGFAGFPIGMVASFSYQNYGSREVLKRANALYVEGYVSANAKVMCTVTYELDGCATTQQFAIDGSDKRIVCIASPSGSIGKLSLGKAKLGGDGENSLTGLPPKFRVEKTFPNRNFFECSVSFEVLGVENRFELLAFGLNNAYASEEPTSIRQ